jgi:hypothetical protein
MRGIRKLAAVAVVAVTAVAVQVGGAGSVFADSGTATHYSVPPYSMDFTGSVADDYTGPADLGTWSCSGVRVTNAHHVRDNFTCSTTATEVTATFSDSIAWPCGCSGWASDFDGRVATSYEIDISGGTVNGWSNYN